MIIFNTTYLVAQPVEKIFLEWMATQYVPKVLSTNLLSDPKLYKVLVEEKEGITYSLQFAAESVSAMNSFKKTYLGQLEAEVHQKFGESVLNFSTYLKSCEL